MDLTIPSRRRRHHREQSCSSSSSSSSSDGDEFTPASPSIPSLQTAHFGSGAGRRRAAAAGSASDNATSSTSSQVCHNDEQSGDFGEPIETATNNDDSPVNSSSVSPDQERQILLLMLLAQVCALHDPTPRTFTVHTLELFERGVLDRESIHFLFELGLVPSTTTVQQQRTPMLKQGPATRVATTATATVAPNNSTELALTTTTTAMATSNNNTARVQNRNNNDHPTTQTLQRLRSIEASAIRRQLSEHDFPSDKSTNGCKGQDRRNNNNTNDTDKKSKCSPENNYNTTTPNNNNTKPWDVEHFPLSLSRYQREFQQIRLLNGGAFGQVYHAIRELDGCEYAIKKITFDSIGYSNESISRVIREVQCLAMVSDHPNIVRYYTSWLEPSWMTGGNSSNGNTITSSERQRKHLKQLEMDAKNHASPQKLLADIEHLVDDISDDSDNGNEKRHNHGSSWSSESSYSSSSSCESAFNDDSTYSLDRPLQRRSSWNSSVKSADEVSWSQYNMDRIEPWIARAYDDSYISHSSRRRRKHRTSRKKRNKATAPPKHQLYKYQISLYIQMQLCHPATLQDWIRERNRQIHETDHLRRIGPAIEIFSQLCSGLAHVHEKGIIHRDLKPANVFASNDGKVIKIGDFGLSKQLHDIADHVNDKTRNQKSTVTQPLGAQHINSSHSPQKQELDKADKSYWQDSIVQAGIMVPRKPSALNHAIVSYNANSKIESLTAGIGTASYAAPEQVKSKNYDTAVDIFSAGLILLELICCFETEHERLHNFQQCRYQKLPPWIEEHYPDIAWTIRGCTKLNACDRPTAKELVEIVKNMSPKTQTEIHLLKGQLLEKEKEIAEKDKLIENLRSEMEKLKSSQTNITGPPEGQSADNSYNHIVFEEANIRNDDG